MVSNVAGAAWWLALCVWVGGLATLAFIVAPTLFREVPTRSGAGALFGRMLFPFGAVEVTCGLILCFAAGFWMHERPGVGSSIRFGGAVAMLALAMLHHLWVFPSARRLREQISDFDSSADGDPRRTQFRRLHGVSSALAMATLLLGLALILHGAVGSAR